MKNLCSGTQCGGFQFLLILDLWGVSFQAAVVFGLGKDFLFKSTLEHCEWGKKEDQEFVPKFLLGPMHVCGLYVQ